MKETCGTLALTGQTSWTCRLATCANVTLMHDSTINKTLNSFHLPCFLSKVWILQYSLQNGERPQREILMSQSWWQQRMAMDLTESSSHGKCNKDHGHFLCSALSHHPGYPSQGKVLRRVRAATDTWRVSDQTFRQIHCHCHHWTWHKHNKILQRAMVTSCWLHNSAWSQSLTHPDWQILDWWQLQYFALDNFELTSASASLYTLRLTWAIRCVLWWDDFPIGLPWDIGKTNDLYVHTCSHKCVAHHPWF